MNLENLPNLQTSQIEFAGGVTGSSFTGSFVGDGSGLTGVTSEWDGTRDGDSEITGSLEVTEDLTVGSQIVVGTSIGTQNPVIHSLVSNTSENILLESSDTGAGSAPDLVLFRNAGIPQDDDTLGVVEFKTNDVGGSNPFVWNGVYSRVIDASQQASALTISAFYGSSTANGIGVHNLGDSTSTGAVIISPNTFNQVPQHTLDVQGDARITTNLYITGSITGSSFTGSFVGDGSGLTGITTEGDWYDGTTYLSSSKEIRVTGTISGSTKLTIGSSHTNSGTLSSIAGGGFNKISSATHCSSILGGYTNTISGSYSSIVGGVSNCIRQNSLYSTVGGGENNYISGSHSTIAGGRYNYIDASATCSFIGGGQLNTGSACLTTIGGGCSNVADHRGATVGGGFNNSALGIYSTIGGGGGNKACLTATVAGGDSNEALGQSSFVGGGNSNDNCGNFSSILGGANNCIASANARYSAILGGRCNTIASNHTGSFIAGQYITSDAPDTTYVNNLHITGSTTLHAVMKISRRETTPSAVEGMIIASGSAGSSKLYYYDGTSWNALF